MVAGEGRFSGRTAVVTGGAGGIGREACLALAAQGARVAVVDLEQSAADGVAEEINAPIREGDVARGYAVDVRDGEAVTELFARVHEELGGPSLLVTLAGGSLGTPRDLGEVTGEDLDLVIDVNLKGTFLCAQAAVPYMELTGRGAIVTVSSIGGRQPSPVTGIPYAASKAAILGLTRRLAREVAPQGIRVNAVAPGLFLTGRLQRRFDEMPASERDEVLSGIPLGRLPELRELVDPILWLCSDEASYLTGVVLDVNGGRFMPQ